MHTFKQRNRAWPQRPGHAIDSRRLCQDWWHAQGKGFEPVLGTKARRAIEGRVASPKLTPEPKVKQAEED